MIPYISNTLGIKLAEGNQGHISPVVGASNIVAAEHELGYARSPIPSQLFFNQHYTIPTSAFTLTKIKKRRIAGPLGSGASGLEMATY